MTKIKLGLLAITLALAGNAARADTVGTYFGHWSHHWVSDSITNEEHAWISFRYNWFTLGRMNNSFKQEGFSGETYHIGVVHDWTVWEDVNRWDGDILIRGSAGLTYGYTEFAGHDPDKDKGVHPYAAVGVYYQQAFSRESDWYWEAGAMQFGDATVPSGGITRKF